MKRATTIEVVFGILLLAIFVGCNAPPANSPTSTTNAPTTAPIETVTPISATPQRQATAAFSFADAARVFPLQRGAQWVYQEIAYDTIPNDVLPQLKNRQITATLWITDTVTDTQTRDANYAAQVVRERTLITTTLDLALLGEYGDDYFANNAPATKWYIFADDKIYSQFETLDWDAVLSSTLELQLPLTEDARWYPDPEQRAQFSVNDGIPGLRAVERAPLLHLPAGEFADCFILHDFYNGGDVMTEFCPGIGIVGEYFDHAGTPFGTHSVLLKFSQGR